MGKKAVEVAFRIKNGARMEWILYIFIIVSSIHAIACRQVQWEGKISFVNGIRIVENPEETKWSQRRGHLVQDLIVGGEENTRDIFHEISAVDIAPNGSLYILDSGDSNVVVYDSDGHYQYKFGRAGSGPGEFGEAVDLGLDSSGHVYVLDRALKRINKFDAMGQYLDSFRIDRYTSYLDVMNEDVLLLSGMLPQKFGAFGGLLDLKNNRFLKHFNIPFESPNITSQSTISLEERYQILSDGYIYLAVPFPYEIMKFKTDGSQLEVIKLKDTRVQAPIIKTINEGHGIYIRERGRMGPCFLNSRGYLFNNCQWESKGDDDTVIIHTCIDVFDQQRRYFLTVSLPNGQRLIAVDDKDRLYVLEQELSVRIIRYRLMIEKIQ